jgi:hypothetical protein
MLVIAKGVCTRRSQGSLAAVVAWQRDLFDVMFRDHRFLDERGHRLSI